MQWKDTLFVSFENVYFFHLLTRFFSVGFLLLHQLWNQVELQQLFLGALKCGWVTPLFRDETIYTHHFVQHFFESQKGDNKKISKVKETFNFVIQNR